MKMYHIFTSLIIMFILFLSAGCMDDNNRDPVRKMPPAQPSIHIINPSDGAIVSGMINISGISNHHDNRINIVSIEYRINSEKWHVIYTNNQNYSGDTEWFFLLDTTLYQDGLNRVEVRVCDDQLSEEFFEMDSIEIIINNNDSSSNSS